MKKTIPFFLLLLAFACIDNDAVVTKMRVNHYSQPPYMCQTGVFSNGPYMFVQQQKSIGGPAWEIEHVSDIEGFTFEMGYTCDVMVKIEEIKNPPADASSIRWTLVSVVSKEKVPDITTFQIHLSSDWQGCFKSAVIGDLSSGFRVQTSLMASYWDIDCGNLCNELSAKLADKKIIDGVFTHIPGGVKLVELKEL
jgi:hypothetical protein